MKPRILGVDVGGVLIDRVADGSDTSFFSSNYLHTPEVPSALDALTRLAPTFDAIHIVSKCGKETERKTREWLATRGFHAVVPAENLWFCRQRKEKAPICERLGITHFVDDRLEVLSYLESVPARFLFRGEADEIREHESFASHVTRVESWHELLVILLGALN